jgi:hypothetical protein
LATTGQNQLAIDSWGASLSTIALSISEVLLPFVHALMADGEDERWDLAVFERLVLDHFERPWSNRETAMAQQQSQFMRIDPSGRAPAPSSRIS